MKKFSKKQKKLFKAKKGREKEGKLQVSQQEIYMLFATAVRLFEAGKHKEAAQFFTKVLLLFPKHHQSHNFLGLIASSKGNYQEAAEKFQEAIRYNSQTASYYNNLGNSQKELGDYLKAALSYQKCIDLKPDDFVKQCTNKGNALLALGTIDEARTCFEKVIEVAPDFDQGYINLGTSYKQQGDFSKVKKKHLSVPLN